MIDVRSSYNTIYTETADYVTDSSYEAAQYKLCCTSCYFIINNFNCKFAYIVSAPEAFSESSVERRYLVPVSQGTYVPLRETESGNDSQKMVRGRRRKI